MTMYYAAVKYAVHDTDDRKIRALAEGLEVIAMSLIEEFDLDLAEVQEYLDNAATAAEWCDSERRARAGEAE